MDFVLLLDEPFHPERNSEKTLPRPSAVDAPRNTLLSEPGSQRLEELLSWFVDNKDSEGGLDIYAALPKRAGEKAWLLKVFMRWSEKLSIGCFLLIAPDQLTTRLLQDLEAAGLTNLIFTANSNNDAQTETGLRILAEYFLNHTSSSLRFGFWLPGQSDEKNFLRLRSFLALGIPSKIVDSPLFTLAKAESDTKTQVPVELLPAFSICHIFSNTLTLDVEGDVRYCSRDAHKRTTLGNIFTDTPEQLMIRKGKHSRLAGKLEMCLSCRLRGRYSWLDKQGPRILQAHRKGLDWQGDGPRPPFQISEIEQKDLSAVTLAEQSEVLEEFALRLNEWRMSLGEASGMKDKLVSIETPVIKGGWLIPCIESVMYQTSTNWELSLLWDEGDDLSRRILERIKEFNHPKIKVFFNRTRQGIAISRAFLSEQSQADFILPLDDDDMLASDAVEKFLAAAATMPWSGIIRAHRKFIDENGQLLDMNPWFPFEQRHYQNGMVTDLLNHSQPYLISRSAYDRTSGWEGFADFFFAGEDCDIFTKIEEVATIELLDECLYYYRLNSQRTSHSLRPEGAYEMWRRLADRTIARLGLNLKRENETQPFRFVSLSQPRATKDQIDFVLPSFESNEEELAYPYRRPSAGMETGYFTFNGRNSYQQDLELDLAQASRLVLVCKFGNPVYGTLKAVVYDGATPLSAGECKIEGFRHSLRPLSIPLDEITSQPVAGVRLQLDFIPERRNYNELKVLQLLSQTSSGEELSVLIMRIFKRSPGNSSKLLGRCVTSLKRCGIGDDAIHLVVKQRSSAANRNEGFAASTRPYICYLDDDVEVLRPDFFEALLKKMEENKADLIGPKIVTDQGRIFCAVPCFNEKRRPIPTGLGEIDEGQYDLDCEVAWLPSTLILVKREVVNAVGGFDESYIGSQLEDVDFCLKARRRDFKCVYTGSLSVVHYNHQRNDSFSENLHFFNEKWKNYPWLFESPIACSPVEEAVAVAD